MSDVEARRQDEAVAASTTTALSAWRSAVATMRQRQENAPAGSEQPQDLSATRPIRRTLSRLALACAANDLPVEVGRPQIEALVIAMWDQGCSKRKIRAALEAIEIFLKVTQSQPELVRWLEREIRLIRRQRWRVRNDRRWREIRTMAQHVCSASPESEAPHEKPAKSKPKRRAKNGETLRETLARPGMKPYAAAAEAAVVDGRLKRPQLLAFAAWRDWRKEQELQGLATDREFQSYSDGDESVSRLDLLTRAIAAITPMSPDLAAIERVRTARRREFKPLRGRDRCGRKPTISVRESALPASWRIHLEGMRAGEPGPNDVQPPAPSIVHTIAQRLKQFAYECEQANLPVAFERSQFTAFIAAMKARGNSHRTVISSLNKIIDFIKYSGTGVGMIEHVKRQISFEAKKHRGIPKKKEKFLTASGLNLIDVANGACAALDELERALSGENPPLGTSQRYAVANEAALLAFVLPFAPRLADIPELIIEKTAMRDETVWWFDFDSHKTGTPFWTRVDERLTIFIDQAILHGLDESYYEQAYDKRLGTRLFVTGALNQPACYHWATQRFAKRFGIGVHIVRDLLQKWAAQEGYGLADALAICGHRSMRSAEHYVSREAKVARIRRMQERLSRRRAS